MALSSIISVPISGSGMAVAPFIRDGVIYIAWTAQAGSAGARTLSWRVHDGASGSEVTAALPGGYNRVTIIESDDGDLLVVYDDSDSVVPNLRAARFDPLTGAVVMAPKKIADGSHPSLVKLDGDRPGRFHLSYSNRKKGVGYLRETQDSGVTWGDEKAILSARVREAQELQAVGFGAKHLSIIQTGIDGRTMIETGSFTRTRPVVGVAVDPSHMNHLLSVESSTRGSYLADNMRGGVHVQDDTLYAPTRVRVGTDDGVPEVARFYAEGYAPTYSGGVATPAGANPGAEIARVNLTDLTVRDVTHIGTPGVIVQIAATDEYVYTASYREDVTDGGLGVMRFTDRATAAIATGMHFHGVACSRAPGATIPQTAIVTCRMIGPQNYLSIGRIGANPLAPDWLIGDHALPSRADALALTMYDPDNGYVFASLADRLCVYRIEGLDKPIRLLSTKLILTTGRVMQAVHAPNGNLVCAMGEAGIAVFTPTGETLGQILPSGIYAPFWKPSTPVALDSTITATPDHPYFGEKKIFRCTVAGTTGGLQPFWGPNGVIVDGSARWVEAGGTVAVVNAVALDHLNRRIYAASVLGGPTGTAGRIHIINARGLI